MTDLNLESIDLGSFGINEEPVEQPLRSTMSEAVKVNPDEHAQIKKLSVESDVPFFAVENDKQPVEDQLKLDQIDFNTLSKDSPKTSNYLTNFENASIAHDDIDILSGIEKTLTGVKTYASDLAGGFEKGQLTVEASNIGLNQMYSVYNNAYVADQTPQSKRLAEINMQLGKESREYGFFTGAPIAAAEMLPIMGDIMYDAAYYGLGTGIAGATVAGLAASPTGPGAIPGAAAGFLVGGKIGARYGVAKGAFDIEAGIAFNEFITLKDPLTQETVNPKLAAYAATTVGLINAGLESLSLAALGRTVAPVTRLLIKNRVKQALATETGRAMITRLGLNYGGAVITEGVTEGLQELTNITGAEIVKLIDKGAFKDQDINKVLDNILSTESIERVAEAAKVGTQASMVLGVPGTAASVYIENAKRQRLAESETAKLDALNNDSELSKLKNRDKESFKQFVEEADGDNNTTVFIDAAQTSMYLQEKTQEEINADPALQILAEQVQEAAAVGGEVQVPVADFAGEIAGTEHYTALRDSMTMSEHTVPPFRQEQEQIETDNFVRRMMDTAQENVSEYAEAQEIYQTVRQQLIDSGRVTAQNASVMANLVPAWATAKAQRENKSVQQVYEESGLTIEGPLTGEKARLEGELDVLTQGVDYDEGGQIVTESENFKNWFGDSKVVDEAGEPLVVYHGTNAEFDTFIESKNGVAGKGIYTTPFSGNAKGYGDTVMPLYVDIKNPYIINLEDIPMSVSLRKTAEGLGHDGIIINSGMRNQDKSEVIAFNPTQIKSVDNRGTFDPADPNILRQDVIEQDPFFSQLQKSVEGIKQNKAPGQQWSAMIKKLPIKKEEIEWSGLDEFLKGKKSVTKQEVLDHLAQNQVVIEDVVKRRERQAPRVWGSRYDILEDHQDNIDSLTPIEVPIFFSGEWIDHETGSIIDDVDEYESIHGIDLIEDDDYDYEFVPTSETEDPEGVKVIKVKNGNFVISHITDVEDSEPGVINNSYEIADIIYEIENIDREFNPINIADETKFSQYQLPGGENYKEILLVIPGKDLGYQLPAAHRYGDKADVNRLAHVRMSERTVDGKKVLHIEEIQSDWHQEGRKKGYGDQIDIRKDQNGFYRAYDADGQQMELRVDGEVFSARATEQAVREALPASFGRRGVPDAPFKKTWAMLAMKRMVRYAAENGFDTVAWTQGAEQAARYDLSKQIFAVLYNPSTQILTAEDHNGNEAIKEYNVSPEKLDDYIGKDPANKMREEIGYGEYWFSEVDDHDTSTISGLDLKVGGEGMKAFYDRILPNEVNKFFNKKAWGKAKVGEIEIIQEAKRKPMPLDKAYVAAAKDFFENGYSREEALKGLQKAYAIESPIKAELEEAVRIAYGEPVKLHALPITPKMKEKALSEGLPLFQPTSPGQPGARGYYNPENSLIRMTETSNLSTFLHEYGHFMYDMEGKGNTDMYQSINNWFKRDSATVAKEANKYIDDGEISESDVLTYIDEKTTGSVSKDAAVNRAIHEQFARGFETYLMEGKAPSIELKNAFATIARWLTQLYRTIRGDVNVKLDAEMRQLYDRLLATEEQIIAAEARNRFEPMFTDAAMAGMTKKQFEAYKKKQEKVKDKQTETLRDKLIKQLTRQTTKWWKEEKADLIIEETEDIKTEKVYATADKLKTGDIKLDFATVKEMAGEEKIDKIGRKSIRVSPKLRGMTAKEHKGIHPDQAAAMFGYTSGAEMIHDIVNAPPLKEVVDTRAEAIMVERHGDIMNDGTIERAADDAVKNEERGKLIMQELKVLSKGTAVPVIDRMTIKAIAKDKIGQLSFREIFPGKYRKAEIKASQEAAIALKDGDKQAAASAKMRQVMNYYLGIEASEAKAGTMKIVDRMSRYNKKKIREEIIRAENGYWDQLDKILNRFEFRKSATLKSVENINIWMNDQVENEGAGLVLSNVVLDEGYITHWKNVPYNDIQGVNDSVKNIEHVARYSNKIDLLQEKVDFQKVVNDWIDNMNEKVESKFTPAASVADDPAKVVKWARWAMAQMTKIPFLASWLDGGERAGMSHQLLVQRFTDAYDAEVRMWDETAKPVMDLILNRDKSDVKRHNTKYYIPEIAGTAFHTGNMMGHEIIAVALNTGNESNLRKLLLGEGWANPDNDVEISFQNPKLQAVLSKMTASDWQLVQTIWDQMELLYPALAEVHRKTTGLTPPKIDKTPIEVQGMRLDGGYYPMKYDPSRNNKVQEQEDRLNAQTESMFSNTASIQASVNTGATNERTRYYAPVRLSLDVVQNHFQETIHYITHHDAVRQVNKLIRDNSVTNTIKEKLGPDEYAQLKPWLNDIAKDGREAPVKTYWDDVLQKLRFGITLGVMGFKASTGIIQIAGLSNTFAEMGTSNTLQALRSVVGSPKTMQGAWDFANENSKVMNHRVKTMDREIKNAMSKLQDKKGFLAAAQEASMKHIALIQTYMVDLPTWHAGYIKEMKVSGDEQKAYQYADWAIENTQGSGITKDMASIMRNQSETGRMLTMFMTYFSSLWNLERDFIKGIKAGNHSVTTIAAKTAFLFVIPVLFEMVMRGEFGGDDEPEEKLQKILTGVALYPIQSVPFVRDIASATIGEYGYNISPVASLIEQGTQAVPGLLKGAFTDEEITKSQLKSSSKVGAAAIGLPGINQAWSTGEHLYEVLEEGGEFTFHQLLFGPRRD